MAADAELLTTPRDLGQMLVGASKPPGGCKEKLFDRWTVDVQEKSVVVSDGVTAISVSPDFIENLERARIIDCAVFAKGDNMAWLAYGVDLFGPVSAGHAVNGPEQPRLWLFLQVLELKQDYLKFLAQHAGPALPNRSDLARAASDMDFQVKLVEEVLREPVWSKEIWRKESAGIGIGAIVLDERNITLDREDNLQAFRLAWSADALLSQACALLGVDGTDRTSEFHSAEFRMFKRDFDALLQKEDGELEGGALGKRSTNAVCQGRY